MEAGYLFKAIIALIIVFGLLSILAWVLRKYGAAGLLPTSGKTLKMVDTLYLDNARKIVCVRRNNKHYLLLLGHREIVVDSWEDSKSEINHEQTL